MTTEEVLKRIEHIKNVHYFHEIKLTLKDCDALNRAMCAVEKTIPQKVKRDPFGADCPNCGGRVVYPTTYTFDGKRINIRCDYCFSCGQALDWSEE